MNLVSSRVYQDVLHHGLDLSLVDVADPNLAQTSCQIPAEVHFRA